LVLPIQYQLTIRLQRSHRRFLAIAARGHRIIGTLIPSAVVGFARGTTGMGRTTAACVSMLMLIGVWTGSGLQVAGAEEPTDRHWSGYNPFHAPSRTTDYYGSGDINLDGNITSEDVHLVRAMVAGTRRPNVRADVDGNALVDDADCARLETAVHGAILPGWWNSLSTTEERVSWIRKIIALDFNQMVSHREADSDWGCANFTMRTFLRSAAQILDPANLLYDEYGIAQNTFNLPIYSVAVVAPGFGHSLNAILVGDDPSVFADWLFLEPEAGIPAQPGAWDLPWGSIVHIQRPGLLNAPYPYSVSLVDFQLTQPEVVTLGMDTKLIHQRPAPDVKPTHNNPNMWRPIVLAEEGGMILFNKHRDDLVRATDLHLLASLDGDPNTSVPVFPAGGFHRLLASVAASPGTYHVLWIARTNRQQQLTYGKLDVRAGAIRECHVVATNVLEARLLSISTNEVFVFYPTDEGLVSVQRQDSHWGAPETVLEWTTQLFKIGSPHFAVTTTSNREPRVIWSDETGPAGSFQTTIFETRRHQRWEASQTVGVVDGFIPSLEVAKDSTGTAHLVYANTWYPAFECYSETLPAELWQVVRGPIAYRRFNSDAWTPPVIVASNSFWPTISVSSRDEVYLGWETDHDGRVVPAWMNYTTATKPELMATAGTPYHPAITEVDSGAIVLSWSEVSQWGATANYRTIREVETIAMGIAASPSGIEIHWRAWTGGTFQVEYTDGTGTATWQPLGSPITTQTNRGSLRLPLDALKPVRFYRVKKL
jgi:hypothetical protein